MIAQPHHVRMTAEEYFALPESMQPTNLIDGELIVSPSPVPVHQIIHRQLVFYLQTLIPNGQILYSPLDVQLEAGSVVQPDILWIREGGRCVIEAKRLVGPPDLIVELLSPGTASLDKIDKFRLYERHGVTEYWIADPHGAFAEVYRLDGAKYALQGIYRHDESFVSAVLGGVTVSLQILKVDAVE